MKVRFGKFGYFSYLGKPMFISGHRNLYFDSHVRIFPNCRIESLGGRVLVGSNTSIGHNLHMISSNCIYISENTTLSANVFISDTDHSYSIIGQHIMEQPHEIKEVSIGRNSFIGYGAVILPGTILGEQCVVGANSVVRGKFPSFAVIAGNPAKIIKRYDQEKDKWIKV
ncbi:acyltransferase [Vibrio ishigakensis]|nr:acyltransferase [Vibrio ishigakensis]